MKKAFLLIPVLAAVLAGCKAVELEQLEAAQDQRITIVASREGDGPETRTVRNESNGKILWTPGDQISLFYGSGTDGGSLFTSQTTTNAAVTNFTGTIGVITGGADVSVDQTYFWGLYPYDGTASCDGASITTTLPAYQVATPGSFAPNTFLSVGRSPGLNMAFYNICGGLMIRVQKEGVRKVTLHSNDGPVAGKARIVLDDSGIPSVAEIIDGSDDIVLEAPEGQYLEPGVNYYFVTFPHEFANQYFTLTFETYTEIGTYERKKPFTITRSNFESFTVAIDGNVTYGLKEGNIPVPDSGFKAWLAANCDQNSDGEISYQEAKDIEQIWVNSNDWNIQSLQGIEYMENLTHLYCAGYWWEYQTMELPEHYYISPSRSEGDCPIGTLLHANVSNNRKLVLLNLSHNEGLGDSQNEVDLSNNAYLEEVCFSYSNLEFPEIGHLNNLKHFETRGCHGVVPDFSQFSTLEYLEIGDPWVSDHSFDVDVSNCNDLETFSVDNCSGILTGVEQNTKLKHLQISNWDWEIEPDPSTKAMLAEALSVLTDLEFLNCEGMNMGSLDVSNNTKLSYLGCRHNGLTQLDMGSNPDLEMIDLAWNQIQSLDLTVLPNIITLYIDGNPYTSLNLSNNPELVYLDCSNSQVGDLDLSANPKLKALLCCETNLSTLDLSHNPALEMIDCRWNNITSLNVSSNLHLGEGIWSGRQSLYCVQRESEGNNLLTTLYIAENQVIPFVTENRSGEHIPATTVIQIAPNSGENECSGEHQNEP